MNRVSLIDQLFLWGPVLWTLRIALVIVLAAVGLAVFLYFARFLRPRHFVAMLMSEPPRLAEVAAEVGGAKWGVKLDHKQDEQLRALVDRVEELERAHGMHEQILRDLITRG